MALEKIKKAKGFNAKYWRVLQINSNLDRGDAVVTLGLYKDKATRTADSSAVVDQYQIDLGDDLLSATGSKDTVKNINLSKAYKVFKNRAIAEKAKQDKGDGDETIDGSLAFFSDAIDA